MAIITCITCKNEGEILCASEYNFSRVNIHSTVRREMDNLNIQYTKSLTPKTKTYVDADAATDSSGYQNRISSTDSTATYTGTGLTGYYYSDANEYVYTCCKDFSAEINYIYAEAETELDSGTCVTYDILKASDCSILSSGNELNTFANVCGCDVCNIIVRYKLCSDTGCCSCLKKFAYTVIR